MFSNTTTTPIFAEIPQRTVWLGSKPSKQHKAHGSAICYTWCKHVFKFTVQQLYSKVRTNWTFLHSYSISAWCNTESDQVCFHICAKSDEDNSLISEQDSFWSLADFMEIIYTHTMPCSVLSTVSHLTGATVLQHYNITHTSYNFYLVVPEFMLWVKAISETEFIWPYCLYNVGLDGRSKTGGIRV